MPQSNNTQCSNNFQPEYVIGIDFGHGETSAAIVPIQWDDRIGALMPSTDLFMADGRRIVIPSCYTMDRNGLIYIGSNAVNHEGPFAAYFKDSPSNYRTDGNNADRTTMMYFMGAIYQSIKHNNNCLVDGNHVVYIAGPSGWSDDDLDEYKRMAEGTGIPVRGITKESRAAMLHVQHDTNIPAQFREQMRQGTIILDMGSSTMDLTYYSSNCDRTINYGYHCGASQIENEMLNDIVGDNPPLRNLINAHSDDGVYEKVLFQVRMAKETYYTQQGNSRVDIHLEDFNPDPDYQNICISKRYGQNDLRSLLEKKGFLDALSKNLIDFKEKHVGRNAINYVILTGGASQMDFLRDMVTKCWGLNNGQIYVDNNPSLTISRGIAEVARVDIRTKHLLEKIKEGLDKIKADDIAKETNPKFIQFLTEKTDTIIDKADRDSVADKLSDFFSNKESINQTLLECTKKAYEEYLKANGIQNLINAVIEEYAYTGFSQQINIEQISLDKLTLEDININTDNNNLGRAIFYGGLSGFSFGITVGIIVIILSLIFGGIWRRPLKNELSNKIEQKTHTQSYTKMIEDAAEYLKNKYLEKLNDITLRII